MGMDSNDRPLVSPAKLNQTIRALDANGRLDVILGKKNAAIVRDLNDVVKYVTTVPPGTLINNSGTAGTLLAAMAEAGATGALTGLPLPIASGITQLVKMRKEGRTKAKINEALNALPIAQP
jgi:dihydrodipicolinate synthase/N-acetylneuraminate lyase